MDCIFCKIITKDAPADIVAENDACVAFYDLHPKAPVHILIVPRKHLDSVNELQEEDAGLAGKMLLCAKNIAERVGIAQSGYKLVYNVGKGGGQIIDHLHLHLLGGWDRSPSTFSV